MSEKKKLGGIISGDKLILIGAIVVVYIVFTLLNSNFLSWTNFVNILVASHLVGLVAIGHTYLIIAGQNDLSPGSVAAFSGVLAALLVSWGLNFWLALIVTIVAGIVVGLFNSWMVNSIKLEAFIATLVTQSVIRGFAYIICDGSPSPSATAPSCGSARSVSWTSRCLSGSPSCAMWPSALSWPRPSSAAASTPSAAIRTRPVWPA